MNDEVFELPSCHGGPPGIDRRTAIKYGVAGLAAAATLPIRAQPAVAAERESTGTRERYRRATVIDSLVAGDDSMDPAQAVAAGMTAIVLDVSIYPRTFENATTEIGRWNTLLQRPHTLYMRVLCGADITAAKAASRLGVILACQDASILGTATYSVNEDNIKALEGFHAAGLRVLQITHNERNALGDSYQEKTNAGLSRLGEAVVTAMNRLGMLVDLSHCGDRTTLDAVKLSSRPCAITHAGCRALYDTGRCKRDEIIRALADKGGYFGVFNMSMWLTDRRTVSVDTVVDHIQHVANVAGIEHVGFGSDGPLEPKRDLAKYLKGMTAYVERTRGVPGSERLPGNHVVVPELDSVQRMERLAWGLSRRKYSDDAIEKIIGGNFARIFSEACG